MIFLHFIHYFSYIQDRRTAGGRRRLCEKRESFFRLVHAIVSRGGWFGSSVVFQDDTMVMLLYWRKCLLLVGETKFYGHVIDEGLATRDDEGQH